jgi:hypothetical protein
MAMGIVSDSDFDSELESYKKPKVNSRVVTIEKGRGNSPNTPDSLRKIIGENVIEEGRQATKTLTGAFGISDSSLSAYSHGVTSCAVYDKPNQELKSHLTRARERITKRASHKLSLALQHITDDKLAGEKPRDLAGIAKDMSVIIKNMEPEHEQVQQNNGPTFVVFAPQIMREEQFDVITVQE